MYDFALQRRMKSAAFAMQRQLFCKTSVQILKRIFRYISPETSAAKYQLT